MERRRNETKRKAPIIGERALCRESYVFLTGEMSMGTIGNCYEAPTTDTSASRTEPGTSCQKYPQRLNRTILCYTYKIYILLLIIVLQKIIFQFFLLINVNNNN